MTLASLLQYAGSDPYEDEHDVFAYPIMERLEQDETYQRLAHLRYAARHVEDEVEVDRDARRHALDCQRDATGAVRAYVAWWLGDRAGELLADDRLDTADLRAAMEHVDTMERHTDEVHIEAVMSDA